VDAWDRYTLHHREHHDEVVRLHGGPHHGRIIALSEQLRRQGQVRTPAPVQWSPVQWSLDEPADIEASFETLVYRRQKFAIYDDVDHAVDYYDYWHLEGTPLPRVR
jgi:hypothetical protein